MNWEWNEEMEELKNRKNAAWNGEWKMMNWEWNEEMEELKNRKIEDEKGNEKWWIENEM